VSIKVAAEDEEAQPVKASKVSMARSARFVFLFSQFVMSDFHFCYSWMKSPTGSKFQPTLSTATFSFWTILDKLLSPLRAAPRDGDVFGARGDLKLDDTSAA
jgi:hypothetical protein